MAKPLPLAGLLLLSSALIAPAALAQSTVPEAKPGTSAQDSAAATDEAAEQDQGQETDVSIPGAAIIVTGRRNANIQKAAPAVVSVLSTEDIKRTGEGDIAGALSRVTGLSVVGNGFVYVRGLGERHSSGLLNGSPLPSPEPLKRVVPLDLFPTNVVASSLVQKSYSANFPGEFGGGVINLTTQAVPKESFLSIKGGAGLNTETTGQLGYTYYGSKYDWTGFDNGSRDTPPALKAFFNSGAKVGDVGVDQVAIISQIANGRNSVVQRNTDIPINWQGEITAGTSFDLGGSTLGVIATAGYKNNWRTRDILQQDASSKDLSSTEHDFRTVSTDNHIIVNGLLGMGLEFGRNKIRWTNLYIRDTIKQARLSAGTISQTAAYKFLNQDTAWYERQLIDTQLVGEFKLGDLNVDVRGSYANSQREAPYELHYEYVSPVNDTNPLYGLYYNRLDGNEGTATFAFSDLNEDLWAGGIDLSYPVLPFATVTAGYAYSDTQRRSDRREFRIQAPSSMPQGISLLRPDLLLNGTLAGCAVVTNGACTGTYQLYENTETDPSFGAKLRIHAGYGQVQIDVLDNVNIDLGVRYEHGEQSIYPIQVFTVPSNSGASNLLKKSYWLPTATVTWKLNPDMQLRVNASKTIARPQFRELIFQSYYDPESNTQFRGNPRLTDSQLYNAEVRYEWYFARDQRLSVAGFFKKIDKPIETFLSFSGNAITTSFANAPSANLYGAELETQKYFYLDSVSDAAFFANRRIVAVANYTYTKSKLKVSDSDMVSIYGLVDQPATNYFRDGAPLTGQSDHIANLQLGLEDTDSLSQQTILLTYASKRVTRRGLTGQPDIVSEPGIQLDFVARQGIKIGGIDTELKVEARNITGQKYKEYQDNGTNRVYYNLYKRGTSFSASWSVKF